MNSYDLPVLSCYFPTFIPIKKYNFRKKFRLAAGKTIRDLERNLRENQNFEKTGVYIVVTSLLSPDHPVIVQWLGGRKLGPWFNYLISYIIGELTYHLSKDYIHHDTIDNTLFRERLQVRIPDKYIIRGWVIGENKQNTHHRNFLWTVRKWVIYISNEFLTKIKFCLASYHLAKLKRPVGRVPDTTNLLKMSDEGQYFEDWTSTSSN